MTDVGTHISARELSLLRNCTTVLLSVFVLFSCTTETQKTSDTPCKWYVFKTGQTKSFLKGDDGYYQKGNDTRNNRFLDNNNGTVTDRVTGVTWLKDAERFGMVGWDEANNLAAELVDDGKELTDNSRPGDWRLPTLWEMIMLVDYSQANPALPPGNPFTGYNHDKYWTSTPYAAEPKGHPWNASPRFGFIASSYDFESRHYLWPVRKQALPGQCTCEQRESAPDRFVDNNNGTVTDTYTGLIWLKNADRFGATTWQNGIECCNALAHDDSNLTDRSQPGDWRLPNLRELLSLIEHGRAQPSLPANHPFSGVVTSGRGYWSSTRHEINYVKTTDWNTNDDIETAFVVSLLSGYFGNFYAIEQYDEDNMDRLTRHVWPVKGTCLKR